MMADRKLISVVLALLLGFASVRAADSGAKFPMKYEGGSLNLNQHDKLSVTISNDSLVIVQKKQRHDIPIKAITEVSYGNDVHRRIGAAVGVGIVTFGVGALLALVKTKKHYVGFVWDDTAGGSKGGVVFKVGKGEYRGFLTALEGVTGLKAINADAAGGGGTSKP